MAITDKVAATVLAKCARHCCVCRRYRPLHLQVHHIVEQSAGGSDDEGNLIATCISCHSDVHTKTQLTRRFTVAELKMHRDAVYQLVADGRLPAGEDADADDAVARLSSAIVQALRGLPAGAPATRPQLSPEAVEVLLAAVTGNTPVNVVRYDGGTAVLAGGRTFGEMGDLRSSARYTYAVRQLTGAGLLEGDDELRYVTHEGYQLADDILAGGGQASG